MRNCSKNDAILVGGDGEFVETTKSERPGGDPAGADL
jgi:hypothetical protein